MASPSPGRGWAAALDEYVRWLPPSGTPPNAVTLALPWFLLLAVLEALVAAARGKPYYKARLSIGNLSCGVLQQALGTVLKFLDILPFYSVNSALGVPGALPPTAALLVSVLGVDLAYYWFHRGCHSWNVMWMLHVPHHSSPDYNLTTALRQGAGEVLLSWAFHLPLALLVDLRTYVWWRSVNTVYQFWVHTQMVPAGGLGPLEGLLNTPSHHRVHHARNYGRGNYGGMLIIWDRMFGTFVAEDPLGKPCLYGLDASPVPLGTNNPVWHQLHVAAGLACVIASSPPHTWPRLLFTRRATPYMVSEGGRVKQAGHSKVLQARWAWVVDCYVLLHFLLMVPTFLLFILSGGDIPLLPKLAGCAAIAASLAGFGLVLDGRRAGKHLEMGRLALLAVAALHLLQGYPRVFVCSMMASSASMVTLLFHEPRRGGAGGGRREGASRIVGRGDGGRGRDDDSDGGGSGGDGGSGDEAKVGERTGGRRSADGGRRRPTPKMRMDQPFR